MAIVGVLLTPCRTFASRQARGCRGLSRSAQSNCGRYRIRIAVFGGPSPDRGLALLPVKARGNPGAAAKTQTMMILGLALIESLVLFAAGDRVIKT